MASVLCFRFSLCKFLCRATIEMQTASLHYITGQSYLAFSTKAKPESKPVATEKNSNNLVPIARDCSNNLSVGNSDNKKLAYTKESVTICHQPLNKCIELNLKDEEEFTVYLKHREQLINVKLSENFKKSVRNAQDEAEKKEKSSDIDSIDDLMPLKEGFAYKELPILYMRLAKARLTGLVVVTSIAGYLMAPGPFDLQTLLLCAIGTGFISASANSINQYLEVPYDSQMKRTKNRPIVTGQLSKTHALVFALVSGVSGAGLLYCGVNALTAGLGLANLFLYTAVYTPLKRISIVNTWIGSIVGAIPPLMGWASATGTLQSGALLLGAIMYAWQFPHFCALSWNIRHEYAKAGYKMVAAEKPSLCRRITLRYSVGVTGLCMLAPQIGLTSWWFAVDSIPINAYLCYLSWRFYKEGDSNSSRRLFFFTLAHIPAIMTIMLLCKTYNASSEDVFQSKCSVIST